ncbi:hypothetical protein D3C86_1835110 [compost metagenome]
MGWVEALSYDLQRRGSSSGIVEYLVPVLSANCFRFSRFNRHFIDVERTKKPEGEKGRAVDHLSAPFSILGYRGRNRNRIPEKQWTGE